MSDKKAYEKKLEAQLNEWNAKIDVLKAKADKAGADAKLKYEETIDKLEQKRDEAKDKLEEIKQEGENTWEDIKNATEDIVSDLDSRLEAAIETLRPSS